MEVIVRTVEISRHHRDIVGAVLQVIALAHLQSGDLRDGVFFVGIFQWTRQKCVFAHRLRSVFRINTCGTQEKQLLHIMTEALANDVALDEHVQHDKVGAVERVCHDAAHMSRREHHCIRSFLIKELLDSQLVSKVKLRMSATYKIIISS